jgi:hypothetical protein
MMYRVRCLRGSDTTKVTTPLEDSPPLAQCLENFDLIMRSGTALSASEQGGYLYLTIWYPPCSEPLWPVLCWATTRRQLWQSATMHTSIVGARHQAATTLGRWNERGTPVTCILALSARGQLAAWLATQSWPAEGGACNFPLPGWLAWPF